jgi:4-aminobutyrate aminotransferase-like enzyme
MVHAAAFRYDQGDNDGAREAVQEAIELARATNDSPALGYGLHISGLVEMAGGNPVAAAAANAVIAAIEAEELLANATRVGDLLRKGLQDGRVGDIRGRGLLIGLDLSTRRAAAVARSALAAGFIVNDCTPGRIRLAPPLNLTAEQATTFIDAWPAILDQAYRESEAPA